MYTIQEGAIIEARIKYRMNGQLLMNVFHYKATAAGVADAGRSELLNFAQSFNEDPNGWVVKWSDSATIKCECLQVEAQMIYPARYPYEVTVVNVLGAGAETILPQNVQLSITKVGTAATRRGIGRIEVPGATPDMISDGVVTEAGNDWLESLALTAGQTYGPPVGGTLVLQPVIFNRVTPANSQLMTTTRLQDTVRVSRRRTVRVGQ